MANDPLRILVCVRRYTIPLMRNALADEFDPTFCTSLNESALFLDEHFDLILCGVNFADSRMFEILELAKQSPSTRHAPFICIKATRSILPDTVFASVRKAAMALGAQDFIELYKWRTDFGDDKAFRQLRDCLRASVCGKTSSLLASPATEQTASSISPG